MSGKTRKKQRVATRSPLIFSVVEELRKKGYNQSEIAEMHGVTRQAVSWQKHTYGGALTPRQIVHKAWPWKTSLPHSKSKAYQRLRDHGEFMATGGKGMNDDKISRLISWWAKLRDENIVLEFDPSFPPLAGVAPQGGFRYVPRLESDSDLLIRVNEHTNLTEEGELIWCWPPEEVFVRR